MTQNSGSYRGALFSLNRHNSEGSVADHLPRPAPQLHCHNINFNAALSSPFVRGPGWSEGRLHSAIWYEDMRLGVHLLHHASAGGLGDEVMLEYPGQTGNTITLKALAILR